MGHGDGRGWEEGSINGKDVNESEWKGDEWAGCEEGVTFEWGLE